MDITWSLIEKDYQYKSVVWYTDKNGIPGYVLFDKDYNKIAIDNC